MSKHKADKVDSNTESTNATASVGSQPSTTIASKWNARYAFASELPAAAHVLLQGAEHLPENGTALDIACGRGANAVFLAEHGLTVQAWDISENVIQWLQNYQQQRHRHLLLDAQVRDVVACPPKPNSVNVIVVSRFLHRPLCQQLVEALLPGGVLFYQTFIAGLSNPDYLLAENELPNLFSSLQQLHYVETPINEEGVSEAMYVGIKHT